MYFGIERGTDGVSFVVIFHRPTAGVGKNRPGAFRLEFLRLPVPGGGLHIEGVEVEVLRLNTDRREPLAFDLKRNEFRNRRLT